jgi:cytochrome c556
MKPMKKFQKTFAIIVVAGLIATPILADSHIGGAVQARQELMKEYGKNIGVLGGMAQGKIDYDATAAAAAADELVRISMIDQSAMWPADSDNFALGADATRAKPELWANFPDVTEKVEAVNATAILMAAAAGAGLDELRGAIGPLGQACGACHKAYRAPKN